LQQKSDESWSTPGGERHGASRANHERHERQEIHRRQRLRAAAVYQIVRLEGEDELKRPYNSLVWSGVAAGVSISLSLIAEGLLRAHLPDTVWRPLIENFGYTVGFLVVILGRQQLFTENTITAVLPLMANQRLIMLMRVCRLWLIVFLANMVGTLISAGALSTQVFFTPEAQLAIREVAQHAVEIPPQDAFFRGIIAGFIVAAIVWTMPSAQSAAFLVVALLTYLIALGDLAHVIAGSVEAFLLAIEGEIGWMRALFGFIVPALFGNILGGTILFALLSYAQVREEIDTSS